MTSGINRSLSLELVRVTEAAAVACAPLIGRGDEKAADQAAVNATRTELNRLNIDGRIVIGEGERDEAPMLYIGEAVGTGQGPKIDNRAVHCYQAWLSYVPWGWKQADWAWAPSSFFLNKFHHLSFGAGCPNRPALSKPCLNYGELCK